MRSLTLWLFVSISVAWASNIIVANDDTFDDIVLNSDKTSFVKFFAEWCSHCKTMIPEWEKLADAYSDAENVQIVEIDADKSRSIGKRYNINSFPTLKLFRADSLSDPIDYQGQREYEFFESFLTNQIGTKGKKVGKASKVVQIHDGNIEKLVENKNRAALLLVTKEKDCGSCDSAKSVFDDISHAFHKELDKIIVGEVQKNGEEPSDWIRNLYSVSEYPAIVFVEQGDVQKFETYEGELDSKALVDFVNNKIGTKRALNGLLDGLAGIIPDMADALKKFVGMNVVDRRAYVSDFIAELKNVDDTVYKNEVKYYALLVNQFISGNNEYVDKELAKYDDMITNKAIDTAAKDLVNMKVNLLKHIKTLYTDETYRDAQEIMAERKGDKIDKDEL